ncbi:hypothetical protein [Aeromicrobium sp. 179-A 4D2 NHS]|uniref:hypothetical protein n=1 Tax=Aeromicrobium sp. 179-A 4D2 NHS TaxID=3142375 RepID=UPI0039A16D6F
MSDSYLPENEPYRPAVDPFEGQSVPPRPTPTPPPPVSDADPFDEAFRPTPRPPAPVDESSYPDLSAEAGNAPTFDPFASAVPVAPVERQPAGDPHRDAAEAVMGTGPVVAGTAPAPASASEDDDDEDGSGLLAKLLLPAVAIGTLAVGFLGAGFLNEPTVETVTETKTVTVAPEACGMMDEFAASVAGAGASMSKVTGDYSKLIVPTFKAGQANNKARGAQILAQQKTLDATAAEAAAVLTGDEFAIAVKECSDAVDGKKPAEDAPASDAPKP